ncbi:MAG: type II toxin-antitoxin system VapC family toxin [Candidatus Kapaibacteriota bacterium]
MTLTLVDTDVLIDASHAIRDAQNALEVLQKEGLLAISTMTEMELLVGCRNKAELAALDNLLSELLIIPFTPAISKQALTLLRQYRLSHGLRNADALIAATALHHALPLLSKNQRDYRFIDDLNLLPYPPPVTTFFSE